MAGEIKHKWNGTILTITSDSGTSSCDLKGRQGDDGCRGPQGPAGIITDANGQLVFEGIATEDYVNQKIQNIEVEATVDLSNYYTKGEVDATIANIELGVVDLSNYYTKGEVDTAIGNIDIPEVDLSNYYTKTEVDMAIDGIEVDLSNYYTKAEVNTAIGNVKPDLSNYYTKSQVEALIPSTTGFITMSAVEAKGYQTASQVNSIVTGKGYQTENQVNTLISGKGYQTAEQVRQIVLDNLPASGEEVYY